MSDTYNWLLETLYSANKTDVETFRIYKCFSRFIADNRDFTGITENITPGTLRFKPLTDVADDCLFGVTFFSEYIETKKSRTGSPGVSFYINAGKSAYERTGYPMISHNWEFWVNYSNDHIRFNK